jgi:transcriptional regulator with XRE-family HTH domain
MLAFRAGLDRTYITDVERGARNISLVNIEKIAAALMVTIEYLFSSERFTANPTYQQKDLAGTISEKFQYHLDSETRVLSFTVKGLLTPKDVDYMDSTLIGICNGFDQGELSLLVDHRFMLAADGEPAVYSPEVASKAVAFQQKLLKRQGRWLFSAILNLWYRILIM